MNNTIILKNISKNFNKLHILNDITYSFYENKFYGIAGESGVGKTTLLQCLGTIDNFSSGELYILGQSVKKMTNKEKAQLRNKHIGFIFQSFLLNDKLTAVENVMLPMLITNHSLKECKQKAEQLLTDIGLGQRLSHYPKQLSGGEQQRTAIARALANNPSIILADEPTGNLDQNNEQKIIDIFHNLAHNYGKTVIMVTHNIALLNQVDYVLKLEDGNLKF